MKIVIAGGSGHVGMELVRYLQEAGHRVSILRRKSQSGSLIKSHLWDGRTLGPWVEEIEGADVIINMAGRSVNCRYTPANMAEMMASRVQSTRVIGCAINMVSVPPPLWLQASTATIYAHRYDAANDELTGIIGGEEPGIPAKWVGSVEIAKAWEAELEAAITPHTRKVALRSAMTMSNAPGSVFDVLAGLTKGWLGGTLGSGTQYVSWIHQTDFNRALQFLMAREDLSGAINLSSPHPLPQADFARVLRQEMGVKTGLPAPEWMLEIGTRLLRTESELVLKSRRVVPTRLLEAGFEFEFPDWRSACRDLLQSRAERD